MKPPYFSTSQSHLRFEISLHYKLFEESVETAPLPPSLWNTLITLILKSEEPPKRVIHLSCLISETNIAKSTHTKA